MSDPSSTSDPAPASPDLGRRLSGYVPVSRTTLHGWPAALFGVAFIGAGLPVLLVGLGVLQVNPSRVHAPMWVISCVGAMFAVAGLVVTMHGLLDVRRRARLRARAVSRPNEPWLSDYEWRPDGEPSRAGTPWMWHVLGAVMMGSMLAMLHWWAASPAGGWPLWLFAGVFDLVMIAVVVQLVWRVAARIKYGVPVLAFATLPVHPGRRLDARLHCAKGLGRLNTLTMRLRFVRERYETHGHGEDRQQVVVGYETHADDWVVNDLREHRARDGALPVLFDLPPDAPVNDLRSRPASYWELEVRADAPGVDFVHRFLVPVYPARDTPGETWPEAA